MLDPRERTPLCVAVWAVGQRVPSSVIGLLRAAPFADGLPVVDIGAEQAPVGMNNIQASQDILLTPVVGSASDFEYQFPASPRYFIGRRELLARLEAALGTDEGRVVVLNAQSGWGKSSLALKMADVAIRRGGRATVLDTRTAEHPRYVVEVLRRAVMGAQDAGILSVPATASWASLESALTTIQDCRWSNFARPVLIFFDQFENVFRNLELTRSFRDLALGVRGVSGPLVVGYAWKTDLVGWTEGHPYQLRDAIRGSGTVFVVEPFGASEVNVLLGRLARQAAIRLLPDLRARLRAYSQGLPWLLKKLADHVLRELRRGVTQEQLLAESLNVAGLFAADLAELTPFQQEVLRHIARFAPLAASEVTERFGPDTVQSLVDRRLVVQVGDRLDTYWDTFRDFLNTGSVPIQDSYILRQTPRSVGRLLPLLVEAGGELSVRELVVALQSSDNAIFNLSRELRLLGVTVSESNRVKLADEVTNAPDPEAEMRRRIGTALRRHRAHSTFRLLAERSGERLSVDAYARELPSAFPAVEVAQASWKSYARSFLFWFEYAGLAVRRGSDYVPSSDLDSHSSLRLLDMPTPVKVRPSVPQIAPRRALAILAQLANSSEVELPVHPKDREAVSALVALGIAFVSPGRTVKLLDPALVTNNGAIVPEALLRRLQAVPGGLEGIALLQRNPQAQAYEVGATVAAGANKTWTKQTTLGVGKHFRSWAKLAGLQLSRQRSLEFPGQQILKI